METFTMNFSVEDESLGSFFPLFYIASILTRYPEEKNLQSAELALQELNLFEIADSIDSENWKQIFYSVFSSSSQKNINSLASDYIKIFDIGKSLNPLYETEYGRNRALAKGTELADIAGFYKAFGLELQGTEMPDHIGIELEFYFYLSLKQAYLMQIGEEEGYEIVKKARKDFLLSHLGRFSSSIIKRPGLQEDPFYLAVFSWVNKLILKECSLLNITPEPIEWIETSKIDMSCCG